MRHFEQENFNTKLHIIDFGKELETTDTSETLFPKQIVTSKIPWDVLDKTFIKDNYVLLIFKKSLRCLKEVSHLFPKPIVARNIS